MTDTQSPAVDEQLATVADHTHKFFIDGEWVDPRSTDTLDVINPATERPIATIALGGAADVDAAVSAADRAFVTFSQTTKEERVELLERVIDVYKTHIGEIARIVSLEMGAPLALAEGAQAPAGLGHL